MRCPPPKGVSPRSGAVLVDVCQVRITSGPVRRPSGRNTRSFDTSTAIPGDCYSDMIAELEFKQVVVSCVPFQQRSALSIVYLGSLGPSVSRESERITGIAEVSLSPLRPLLTITKLHSKSTSHIQILVLDFGIPFVHVDVTKHSLDALQYWADDVSQIMDHGMSSIGAQPLCKGSTLSGGTRSRSVFELGASREPTTEAIVKIAVSDGESPIPYTLKKCMTLSAAFFRALVPVKQDLNVTYPLVISALDVDISIQKKVYALVLQLTCRLNVIYCRLRQFSPSGRWT